MDTPSVDPVVRCECWKAKIPIRLSLKNCGVPDHPLPFYAELPRFAYLPFLFHDVVQFFARSAVEQTRHNTVVEHEGVALPWHIPLGVLYDLVAGEQLPWRLDVSFVSALPCALLPWEDDMDGSLSPLRKLFFNSLKESAYVSNGSDGSLAVSGLELKQKEDLRQSTRDSDLDVYQAILSTLHLPTEDGAPHTVVPVRILLKKERKMLSWKNDVLHLSRPVESDALVLESLRQIFPFIKWDTPSDAGPESSRSVEDISGENETAFGQCPIVSVCSIEPDLTQSTFGWLHKNLHAPDNFLYLVIRPQEKPPRSPTGFSALLSL